MIHRRILLSALALFAALSPCHAQRTKKDVEPTKHPFLWKIEGPGRGYAYGTIHLPDPRVTTLPQSVYDAIEDSTAVYTELELNGRTVARLTKRMILPRRQTLEDVLPKELYRRLGQHLKKRGVPIASFKRQKPWAVTMTVVMLEFQKAGMGSGKALDMVIADEAKDRDKEIGGLETVDEQLNVFEAMTDDEQVRILSGTLDLLASFEKSGENYAEKMVRSYLDGDAEALMALMDSMSGMEADVELQAKFEKLMLEDRNVRMTERIDKMLRGNPDKSRFFAVGTAHWPGDKGMLKLLRDRGYRITRIGAPDAAAAIERKLDAILERLETLEKRVRALEKQGRQREQPVRKKAA